MRSIMTMIVVMVMVVVRLLQVQVMSMGWDGQFPPDFRRAPACRNLQPFPSLHLYTLLYNHTRARRGGKASHRGDGVRRCPWHYDCTASLGASRELRTTRHRPAESISVSVSQPADDNEKCKIKSKENKQKQLRASKCRMRMTCEDMKAHYRREKRERCTRQPHLDCLRLQRIAGSTARTARAQPGSTDQCPRH